MNREQRRAEEHGRDEGEHRQDNLRTEAENQAAAAGLGGAQDTAADPGGVDDATTAQGLNMTGPGAGGSVESGGRSPQHEGMHFPNVPNA